ncbi:MAG TPA: hypothetical protein VMA31_12375 [Bryobacteraceae bacterium]|nr:hypothetical protein [Bryobacteraceae bacterium]
MARGKSIQDESTLQMALVGYQIEREKIETRIRELQAQLKGKRGGSASSQGAARAPRARRQLSAAARARIAAAQKKRWAEHRKRQAQAARALKAQAAS